MANDFLKKIAILAILSLFAGIGAPIAFAQVTETVTISAEVSGTTPPPAEGGGGGGVSIPKTAVRFSGEAYPGATVSILKSGNLATTVLADSLGKFSATLEEQYDNTILYTLFAHDVAGEKSVLINYPIAVYSGYLTHLSGIRFAPTILSDLAQVKQGEYLTLSGYSLPSRNLETVVSGESEAQKKTYTLSSGQDGSYKIVLPLLDSPRGEYTAYVNYLADARISKLVKFTIGGVNIPSSELVKNIPGDCNADNVINLVDFSVLAFWYGKENPPRCVDTNNDGIINLVDFSILAFWWTG